MTVSSEALRWRSIRRKVIQRVIAVLVGIALLMFGAFLPPSWLGSSLLRATVFDVIIYTGTGILLGSLWPEMSWRLGIYLFAIWPPFIVTMFLFSDPPPVIHWKQEILGVLGLLMILPGACLGAWIGSILRRRFSSGASHDDQQTLPTS